MIEFNFTFNAFDGSKRASTAIRRRKQSKGVIIAFGFGKGAYEEIKKLNSEGRGHLVMPPQLDHIFQFTDFNKLITLIDDSIAQLDP